MIWKHITFKNEYWKIRCFEAELREVSNGAQRWALLIFFAKKIEYNCVFLHKTSMVVVSVIGLMPSFCMTEFSAWHPYVLPLSYSDAVNAKKLFVSAVLSVCKTKHKYLSVSLFSTPSKFRDATNTWISSQSRFVVFALNFWTKKIDTREMVRDNSKLFCFQAKKKEETEGKKKENRKHLEWKIIQLHNSFIGLLDCRNFCATFFSLSHRLFLFTFSLRRRIQSGITFCWLETK